MDVVKIPDCVNNATENLIGPASKGIGQTVGDIWYLFFGGPVSQLVQKRQVKYAMELEKFRAGLATKLVDIPEVKRIEPSTQIIMSAMVDAQCCVEEAELRHMFENLISSSVNADRASLVHPSFSGIIRQMTAFDARTLSDFKKHFRLPIVNYSYIIDPESLSTIFTNFFLGSSTTTDYIALSASIDCLVMLGLVTTNYTTGFTNKSLYEPFKETVFYKDMQERIKQGLVPKECTEVKITEGYVELTGHGQQFLKVCMP